VYGPNMGGEHVLPQFILRAKAAVEGTPAGDVPFPIQGGGEEIRSFIYIDDFTDGLMLVIEKGRHNEIYHIGTPDEISIRELAGQVLRLLGRQPEFKHLPLQAGGTARRCPDIARLSALGFIPKTPFAEGLKNTFDWYMANAHLYTDGCKL